MSATLASEKVACGHIVTCKMNTKHIRSAIINLLERELSQGGWSFESLGDKIEVILNFTPIRKQRIDKDAPKKTITAYTFFCRENRAKVVEKMKKDSGSESVKYVDVVRSLAHNWKELKSRCEIGDENSLNEMKEYKEMSRKDMDRYAQENAAFEKGVTLE